MHHQDGKIWNCKTCLKCPLTKFHCKRNIIIRYFGQFLIVSKWLIYCLVFLNYGHWRAINTRNCNFFYSSLPSIVPFICTAARYYILPGIFLLIYPYTREQGFLWWDTPAWKLFRWLYGGTNGQDMIRITIKCIGKVCAFKQEIWLQFNFFFNVQNKHNRIK